MASPSSRPVKVTDLNPHLLCVLCGGYYVDATTIIECLHSFCKSCIVRYLETNKYCPICDVQVHKTKPLLNIRSDRTLQAIVYKLVPGLFQRELNCRKEFYRRQPVPNHDGGEAPNESPVFLPEEPLLLGVQYADPSVHQNHSKRYFRCPAAITVQHLQKLMRAKFDLNPMQRVEFLHDGDLLPDHLSLMDLAYMYHWKRRNTIELEYRLLECQHKKMKLSHEEDSPTCMEAKHNNVESKKDPVFSNNSTEQPDREVQLQISENGVMSVKSVDSSSNNTVVSSKSDSVNSGSDKSLPVKDIQPETIELMRSLEKEVTLNFDSSISKSAENDSNFPTNNNTIKSDEMNEKDSKNKDETTKVPKVGTADSKDHTKGTTNLVRNDESSKNKGQANNVSVSISILPPVSSSNMTVHAQKVYPGANKDPSNPLRHVKVKEERSDMKVHEVSFKPALEKPDPPKSSSTIRYKTLKSPIKPWNPTIPRSAIMAMKQAQAANQEKGDLSGKTVTKAPKFFKMRNVPRFLGNPASGVKPMYQVLPGSELTTQAPQTSVSQTSKPVTTSEVTVMKIDPKTLNPIPISHSRSKLNSSSSKLATCFIPSSKPSERDLLNCGTPIRNPVSKSSSMTSRAPSHVHSTGFSSNPFALPSPHSPHMLYPGFTRPFSPVDSSGNRLPSDSQILRAMSMLCSPGAAFHPSLPPSISMLFNPHHPHHRSQNEKLNFKYTPSDFHKPTPATTPSVQRIPPSGPSSKLSSPASHSPGSASDSYSSSSSNQELNKLPTTLKNEKLNSVKDELGGSVLFSHEQKSKSKTSTSNCDQDLLQNRLTSRSPMPLTNGLSITPKGELDKNMLKTSNKNKDVKLNVKGISGQNAEEENKRTEFDNSSKSNGLS